MRVPYFRKLPYICVYVCIYIYIYYRYIYICVYIYIFTHIPCFGCRNYSLVIFNLGLGGRGLEGLGSHVAHATIRHTHTYLDPK